MKLFVTQGHRTGFFITKALHIFQTVTANMVPMGPIAPAEDYTEDHVFLFPKAECNLASSTTLE